MSQSQLAIKEDLKAGKSRSKRGSVTPIKRSASKSTSSSSGGKCQPAQGKENNDNN